MIRNVHPNDTGIIVDIYNYYIAETAVTFEEDPVDCQEMLARISKVEQDDLPWLVAEDEQGKVIGYAYASKWRVRFAYRFSVEITVYKSPKCTTKGIGSQLYQALFSALRQRSIHSVIGGIFT